MQEIDSAKCACDKRVDVAAYFLINLFLSIKWREGRLTPDIDLSSNATVGKDIPVSKLTKCKFTIVCMSPKIFHGVQALAKAASSVSRE
jgi:hypothetical protein